jgi:hypothetical protein
LRKPPSEGNAAALQSLRKADLHPMRSSDSYWLSLQSVRGQQKTFDTAQWIDYPVAILIAGVLSFFGSLVASVLGFFTLFIAPGIGMLIAEAIRRAVSKRRSVLLFRLSAAAALIGSLPLLIPILLGAFLGGGFYSLIWQGLYTFMITSTVYYRLRGIQMR